MATRYWLGIAKAIAQVTTIQITGYDAATTYDIVCNGVVIATTPGVTDANATASALQAAFDASDSPYAENITATVATDTVTLTGPAGMPFTVSSAVSGGTGTIGAATTGTAATGPAFWSDADNWSAGTVPVSTDDVIVSNSGQSILFGLDQSAVDLASLTIDLTYTGKIGLPFHRVTQTADGETTSAAATEYRDHYLQIGADLITYGAHNGPGSPAGSGRIKIDNDKAGASTLRVLATAAQGSDIGLPPLRYLAAHASADVFVSSAQGGLGIGVDEPGEAPTVGTISATDERGNTNVYTGAGATVGGLVLNGGNVLLNGIADITAITVNGGRLQIEGAYKVTTLAVNDGTVIANNVPASGDAFTTINVNGGAVNGNVSMRARTWNTVNLDEGSMIIDDSIVTVTNWDQPSGLRSIEVSRA